MSAWGFAWPAGKSISGLAPREVLVFWRFVVTLLSYLPLLHGKWHTLKLSRTGILMALSGALFYTAYSELFFKGLENGLPGAGGVLVTTLNPIVTFAIFSILFRKRPTRKEQIGLLLGTLGGAILLHIWHFSMGELLQSGNLFFLIAALMWAFMTINTQMAKSHGDPAAYTFYIYLFSTIFISIQGAGEDFLMPLRYSMDFWWKLLYLGTISTTFGTTVYFYASSRLGSSRASSFIFLVPASAIAGSWFFYSEVPTPTTITGGLIAILAVYTINAPSPEKKEGNGKKPSGEIEQLESELKETEIPGEAGLS